jgi:hypothetical protein
MKTVYKVTGLSFQGHPHGEEFEADLDPALEKRAKARGQIKPVKSGNDKQRKEQADA